MGELKPFTESLPSNGRRISVEEYVDFVYPNLTKDGRRILLSAIKNDRCNFKYKKEGEFEEGIKGQNKIKGLGICEIVEAQEAYMDSDGDIEERIIREYFDEVVEEIVKKISVILDSEERSDKIEEAEKVVEDFIENIYSNSKLIALGLEKHRTSKRLQKSFISGQSFGELLEKSGVSAEKLIQKLSIENE
jgi:hypothetical protein